MISTVDESTAPSTLIELPSLKFIDPDPAWRKLSACADHFDVFFDGRKVAEAKSICSTCPVQGQCLEFALRNDERDGIWGGLTAKERKAL